MKDTANDHDYINGGNKQDLNQTPDAVDEFARIQGGNSVPADTHDDEVEAIIEREQEEPKAEDTETNMVNTGDGDDNLVSDATDVASADSLINIDATD